MGVYYLETRDRWVCKRRYTLETGERQQHLSYHQGKKEAVSADNELGRLIKGIKERVRARRTLGLPDVSRPTSSPTFGAYFETWVTGREAVGLRLSTIKGYRQHGRARLLPQFGHLRLDEVTVRVVQGAVTDWRADGMGLGGVRAVFRTLSSCLGRAAKEQLISQNPVPRVDLPRAREDESVRRALTEEDAAKLVAELRYHWAVLVRVALGTGLRISEVGRLRWEDLDLAGDPPRLTVHRAKSGRARLVPILPDAVEALHSWSRSIGGRVFPLLILDETDNVSSGARSTLGAALGRAAVRAGIEGPVRPHDLRHTWATRLGLAGVPMEAMRAWGGWSELGMVSRYCNADPVESLRLFSAVAGR